MAKRNASKAVKVAVIGLSEIVAAGANGLYTSPEVHAQLLADGLVEINETMTDEAGHIATRATQKGIDSMSKTATAKAPAAAPVNASGFAIEDGIALPSVSGRGRTATVYPFDALQVGQSFFVPNSEDKPNAAKSLASTVSSATARYAVPAADGSTKINGKGETVPVMTETRKFVVRSRTAEQEPKYGVAGARIYRVA